MTTELSNQQKEHQRLAANYPKTDAEKDHVKNVAASNALESLCPLYARTPERTAMVAARLVISDERVADPTDLVTDVNDTEGFGKPRPITDRARRWLSVAYARVAGPDGAPRMIPDLSTGIPRYFTIEELIKELHETAPGFRWKLGTL